MERIFNMLYWLLRSIRKRTVRHDKLDARAFSNEVLRKYLVAFSGDVINVSGWKDADKQGGFYRKYYSDLRSYTISNIEGVKGISHDLPEGIGQIVLDLNEPVDPQLHDRFDVVFSHTVLEHVYNVRQALENIVELSKDVIVTVVPFSQGVHYTTSYSDYVRLSPHFLKTFFKERGFEVMLSTANENPFNPIYVVFIVAKHPERYREHFKDAPLRYDAQILPSKWGKYGDKTGLDVSEG